jgi:hypothetical protein
MNNISPTEDSLRLMLDILWKDLFHVRNQTWKALEIEILLVLLLVLIDFILKNIYFTIIFSCIISLAIIAGIKSAIHHRKTQLRTLAHIKQIENELGLIRTGLIDHISKPKEVFLSNAFNYNCNSTPIFIIRIHLVLLFISMIYPFASYIALH